jgi:hypothetical protein
MTLEMNTPWVSAQACSSSSESRRADDIRSMIRVGRGPVLYISDPQEVVVGARSCKPSSAALLRDISDSG